MTVAARTERQAELFLDMLAAERGAAANTLAAYRRDPQDYGAFLAGRGTALADADGGTIRSFLASLEARGLKPADRAD